MTKYEKMIELAGNSVEYNADTMPSLEWEEGTGFFFEDATSEELKEFAKANNLPLNSEQSELEGFIDKACLNVNAA